MQTGSFMASLGLQTWKKIGLGKQERGLYILQQKRDTFCERQYTVAATGTGENDPKTDFELWHYRLGHSMLPKAGSFLKLSKCKKHEICHICPLAKMNRLPFSISEYKSEHRFDLIHCDIWGPCNEVSYDGFRFFLSIVDDYSRCTWVFLLKSNSEVWPALQNFYTWVETQFGARIKVIRSDNGEELLMPDFYSKKGIMHQRSCVETPQQNGRVERKHQQILNIARALKFQSGLELKFWSDFILMAVYIMNRVPSTAIQNRTPFERLYKRKPTYTHMRVFGCLAFASTLTSHWHKFDPRAGRCVFLGCPLGMKGYKLLDVDNGKILVSRNVVFHEWVMPLRIKKKDEIIAGEQNQLIPGLVRNREYSPVHEAESGQGETESATIEEEEEIEERTNGSSTEMERNEMSQEEDLAADERNSLTETRRSSRERRPPTWLKDCVWKCDEYR